MRARRPSRAPPSSSSPITSYKIEVTRGREPVGCEPLERSTDPLVEEFEMDWRAPPRDPEPDPHQRGHQARRASGVRFDPDRIGHIVPQNAGEEMDEVPRLRGPEVRQDSHPAGIRLAK